jgi:hypothetical protein
VEVAAITKHCSACNPSVVLPACRADGRADQKGDSMPTYRGSSHCGAVTFSLVSEIEELTTCDCSLCRQRNALMTKVHESALTVESGADLLSVYEWNTHRAKHFFCSRCGIYTFHR